MTDEVEGTKVESFIVGSRGRRRVSTKSRENKNESIDEVLKDSNEEIDDYLGYYQTAELLMEQLAEGAADGTYTVGMLPVEQKQMIFFYLSVFHPKISRIINLHTRLPLSSLRIQKPAHEIDIVQDYVYDYFESLMESTHFRAELKKIIRYYWIFGDSQALIEDDFQFLKDTLYEPDLSDIDLPELSQQEMNFIEEINSKYNKDPSSVTWTEKLSVLKKVILDVNPDYKGIINFKAIFPLDLDNAAFNDDIDYWLYSMPKSKGLQMMISSGKFTKNDGSVDLASLKRIGYSEARIRKELDDTTNFIELDNDPFNDEGIYVARMSNDSGVGVDASLLNSVIESAVQNLMAIRKSNVLVALASKIDRIVSAPNASYDQLATLNADLENIAEDPEGHLLAVNFDVSVEELALSVKDSLDLADIIDRTDGEILSSLGMPEELISGEGTYGSGFLKVELLTNEYVEFRNTMKDFIENQIFKPIAIKKGFVAHDAWGNLKPIIPRIRFDKFSISRGSEDLSQMISLVSDGVLPVEVLLEHMGFTVEDIEQKLLRQQSTMFNSSIKEMMDSAMGDSLSEKLANNPEFIKKITDALGIDFDPSLTEDTEEEE